MSEPYWLLIALEEPDTELSRFRAISKRLPIIGQPSAPKLPCESIHQRPGFAPPTSAFRPATSLACNSRPLTNTPVLPLEASARNGPPRAKPAGAIPL